MVKSNDINSLTLVIAHPDDEVMFFAPTLLNLNDVLPKRIPFHVVCYSNGDAEGLGDIRYKELQHSVKILLSDRDTNVTIYDHKDGMHEEWDQKLMINQLENIITIPKTTPKQNIILTFDKDGVSNHINHKTCYNASLKYFKQYEKSTILLTLNSYHRKIVMKYSSFGWECMKLLNTLFNPFASKIGETTPFNTTHITIFSTHMQYILSLASMVNAHKSQMVWYRYFWWVFSRFVYVNDLEIV